MGKASYMQTSFLGGEWSQTMQGRADRPDYRSAMNLCRNSLPIEEGAWTRRPGTAQAGATRNGAAGVLREFHFNQANPYTMELTNGFLRFRRGTEMTLTDEVLVTSFSDGDIVTALGTGWSVGDQVMFSLVGAPVGDFGDIAYLLGTKQFRITTIAGTAIHVVDTLLGAIPAGRVMMGTNILKVSKVQEFATPYLSGIWADVRTAQDEEDCVLFHGSVKPYAISVATSEADSSLGMAQFDFGAAVFADGPYLDPPEDGSYLTPSGLSGTITLTETGSYYAFSAGDVGRLIRLQSEPAEWVAGSYAANAVVKFNDAYYRALAATSAQPDLSLDDWAFDVTAAAWTWGTIATAPAANQITVTLAAADPKHVKAGGDLLYSLPIKTWRLGVYSEATGFPTCGTFHEGRLWLGSIFGNRIDSSMSNRTFDMAPTLRDGTVADNNGISAIFKATDSNRPYWLLPDSRGIVVGTQGGEWLVRASDLNDPLTPTSIQVHRETDFGCENVQAILTPLSKLFVQRDSRRLIELTAASGPSKFFQGQDLSVKAKHFTADGIKEITYQKEMTPIVWAATLAGDLIGCTYRRDAQISSDPVTFAGWHKHTLGTGREVLSVQAGPSVGGDTDTLNLLTRDPATGFHFVELLTDIFQEDSELVDAWFVDGAANPSGADLVDVGLNTFLRIYGLDYAIGESLTAFIGGLDMGDYVVSATGTIDVPVGGTLDGAANPLTLAYLATLSSGNYAFPTTVYTGSGAATYTMEARENYSPSIVAYLEPNNDFETKVGVDNILPGLGFDPVRRKIFYGAIQYREGFTSTIVNPSGFKLWGGSDNFGTDWFRDVDDNIAQNNEFVLRICEKDIDTDAVIWYDAYDVTKTVPAGIDMGTGGMSDGTERRMVVESDLNGNYPTIVDPRTGNVWMHTQSCELYCFRRSASYAQEISPLFPGVSQGVTVKPVCMNDDWVFAIETSVGTYHTLRITPRVFTADEIAADYILSYSDYNLPVAQANHVYDLAVAETGDLYLFSASYTGTSDAFELWRFDPPTLGAFPATGGGWTEVTPWGTTAGPNASLGNYATRGNQIRWWRNKIMSLPDQDNLVCVSQLYPDDHTGLPLPAYRMDVTYYNYSTSATSTFQNVVGQYMTAAWVVTTDPAQAEYEIDPSLSTLFVNSYLDIHSYDFGGDYSTRWIMFTTFVDAGASSAVVFVKYQFVPGAAPVVLRVIDERTAWDVEYPEYATEISGTPVVYESLRYDDLAWNTGREQVLFDPASKSFWIGNTSNSLYFLNMDNAYRNTITNTIPPFLRLSFDSGTTYITPATIGKTFTSDAQIVRPIASQETGAITGPASGKTRRTHQFSALMLNTKGISFATDFDNLRPARLRSPGGAAYTVFQLYSGTHEDVIEDSYGFDSMICWRITRPYPATVLSIGAFLQTQDR